MFILCVCVFSLHVCVCTIFVLGAHNTRRGHWIPWNWSCRWFWAALWVLAAEPRLCESSKWSLFLFYVYVCFVCIHFVCHMCAWCQQNPKGIRSSTSLVAESSLQLPLWLLLELLHFPSNSNGLRLMVQMVLHGDNFGHATYCWVFLIFVMRSIVPAQL